MTRLLIQSFPFFFSFQLRWCCWDCVSTHSVYVRRICIISATNAVSRDGLLWLPGCPAPPLSSARFWPPSFPTRSTTSTLGRLISSSDEAKQTKKYITRTRRFKKKENKTEERFVFVSFVRYVEFCIKMNVGTNGNQSHKLENVENAVSW